MKTRFKILAILSVSLLVVSCGKRKKGSRFENGVLVNENQVPQPPPVAPQNPPVQSPQNTPQNPNLDPNKSPTRQGRDQKPTNGGLYNNDRYRTSPRNSGKSVTYKRHLEKFQDRFDDEKRMMNEDMKLLSEKLSESVLYTTVRLNKDNTAIQFDLGFKPKNRLPLPEKPVSMSLSRVNENSGSVEFAGEDNLFKVVTSVIGNGDILKTVIIHKPSGGQIHVASGFFTGKVNVYPLIGGTQDRPCTDENGEKTEGDLSLLCTRIQNGLALISRHDDIAKEFTSLTVDIYDRESKELLFTGMNPLIKDQKLPFVHGYRGNASHPMIKSFALLSHDLSSTPYFLEYSAKLDESLERASLQFTIEESTKKNLMDIKVLNAVKDSDGVSVNDSIESFSGSIRNSQEDFKVHSISMKVLRNGEVVLVKSIELMVGNSKLNLKNQSTNLSDLNLWTLDLDESPVDNSLYSVNVKVLGPEKVVVEFQLQNEEDAEPMNLVIDFEPTKK